MRERPRPYRCGSETGLICGSESGSGAPSEAPESAL